MKPLDMQANGLALIKCARLRVVYGQWCRANWCTVRNGNDVCHNKLHQRMSSSLTHGNLAVIERMHGCVLLTNVRMKPPCMATATAASATRFNRRIFMAASTWFALSALANHTPNSNHRAWAPCVMPMETRGLMSSRTLLCLQSVSGPPEGCTLHSMHASNWQLVCSNRTASCRLGACCVCQRASMTSCSGRTITHARAIGGAAANNWSSSSSFCDTQS